MLAVKNQTIHGMMNEQHNKNSEPDRIEWYSLLTTEQISLLKQAFYEAIKVFNSEAMKKHWKKFIKTSTEGKLKEKAEQEKVSLHIRTQAQKSLEGPSFEVKLKRDMKKK